MNELNYEKVFNTLVDETALYATSNGLNAMVLGISGGIDSAVVAAICHEVSKQAGIPLIGRSLPIKNKEDEFSVSRLVGEAFCNDFRVVEMPCYDDFLETINVGEEYPRGMLLNEDRNKVYQYQTSIANGNIQANLRTIYLRNLAGIRKGIIMDTTNQTEYQLGFWSVGSNGDYNPIQDLWKTEVYGLADYLIDMYFQLYCEACIDGSAESLEWERWWEGKYKALEQSIALTPTDGLGISKSDLDQIGAKSYDEVDNILRCLIFYGETTSQSNLFKFFKSELEDKYGQEVVDKVWNRHLASEFKRKKAPIYIERSKYE